MGEKNFQPKTDLFQTASDPGEWVDSLQPKKLKARHGFGAIQILPLSGVFILFFLGSKKRNKIAEDFRIKKANLRRKLNECVDHRDAVGFFRAFKDLLKTQLSRCDKSRNIFALSSVELITFINKQNITEHLVNEVEDMLKIGDDLEFAEGSEQTLDFKTLRDKALKILKELKMKYFLNIVFLFTHQILKALLYLVRKNNCFMMQLDQNPLVTTKLPSKTIKKPCCNHLQRTYMEI